MTSNVYPTEIKMFVSQCILTLTCTNGVDAYPNLYRWLHFQNRALIFQKKWDHFPSNFYKHVICRQTKIRMFLCWVSMTFWSNCATATYQTYFLLALPFSQTKHERWLSSLIKEFFSIPIIHAVSVCVKILWNLTSGMMNFPVSRQIAGRVQ